MTAEIAEFHEERALAEEWQSLADKAASLRKRTRAAELHRAYVYKHATPQLTPVVVEWECEQIEALARDLAVRAKVRGV